MLVEQKKSTSSLPESVMEVLPIAHGHCLSLWMVVGIRTETPVPGGYQAQNPGHTEMLSLVLPCFSSTFGLSRLL